MNVSGNVSLPRVQTYPIGVEHILVSRDGVSSNNAGRDKWSNTFTGLFLATSVGGITTESDIGKTPERNVGCGRSPASARTT